MENEEAVTKMLVQKQLSLVVVEFRRNHNGDMQGQRVMVVFFAVLITMQVVRLATQRGSVIWWPAGRRKSL